MRVVVIGAGAMGRHHARVFAAAAGARLAGVYDLDEATGRRLSNESGVPAFGTLEHAIAAADLCVIATPIASHASITRQALTASRHVLVEKPIAGTSPDASALAALAEARGVGLFVGHSERFNGAIRALATYTAGAPPRSLAFRRVSPPRRALSAGSLLLNLAVHDIDLAAFLFRAPVSVVPELTRVSADDASIVVTAADGRRAHIAVGRAGAARERMVRATAAGHQYEGDLLVPSLRRDGEAVALDGEEGEPLALQAADVIRCVLGGGAPRAATGREGAAAVEVAAAAEQGMPAATG